VPQPVSRIVACEARHHLTLSHAQITWPHVDNPAGRVKFALEGDGSLLMQLGCLSTIAMLKLKNLTMVVMDQGPSHARARVRQPL
jgi:hypothetical protein